jgi:transposase
VDNATRWVGIDLHRRRSFVTAIDEQGEVSLRRRIANDPDEFLELLGDPEGTHVVVEATYGWEWLADLLEDAGYELHLAHPLRTRAIAAARVKTDAVDATTLAQLLRAGLLPEAYIAPRELRDVRELLRHRVTLVAMRSAIKNRVHAILARHGVIHQHADLFGKAGRQFLATVELRPAPRQRIDSPLALLDDFDREIDVAGKEIDHQARADERVKLLWQIHGIGRYTAMLIIDRRCAPIPHRPPPVRLGRIDPHSAQLRRQSPAGEHLAPGILDPALGRRRSRHPRPHPRRAAARAVRTDRQTPRAQSRPRRRRPPDPHTLLLRPARRRDPLPQNLPARRAP